MTVTAIIGAQYGSEGKGVVAARLADRFQVAVRTGGPNAGHTFSHRGLLYKMRQIPCAWINPTCELVLGAGAVIDPIVLAQEIRLTGRIPYIDRQAAIILAEDKDLERGIVERIGSTGEGVGSARMSKILRDPTNETIATHHYPESAIDTVAMLWQALNKGKNVMLEGTQGAGLSLHHGNWPYVTSNDTNVAQFLADAGIAPEWLVHTLLVARTYPIRVGGPSGPLKNEQEWQYIPGNPMPERTTVTNRERRIGLWDPDLFMRAVMLNEPCGVALTFADYMDPGIRDKQPHEWSDELWTLIQHIEREVPVVLVGVGGEEFTMVQLHRCTHGEEW